LAKKTLTTTQHLFSIHFVNENLGFVVGYGGIMLRTTNGGMTWTETTFTGSAGETLNFKDVYFVNESVGYIVGLNGIIFKTTNG